MDASKEVDKYIAELTDWRGEFVAELRQIISDTDPKLTEEWKWKCPVWSKDGLVCSVGAFKDKVKFNFFKNEGLKDPQGLINAGQGSKQPAIDFKQGDMIDEKALKALIKSAISLN